MILYKSREISPPNSTEMTLFLKILWAISLESVNLGNINTRKNQFFGCSRPLPPPDVFMSDPLLTDYPLPGVVRITLNRPNRCNALSWELLVRLQEILSQLPEQEEKVVILRGAGKHFCSGLDLAQASSAGIEDGSLAYAMPELVTEILRAILTLPQTVIAAVHGAAIGGGGALAAVSDYVIAGESARIGFPELWHALDCSLLYPFLRRRLSASALKALHLRRDGIDRPEAFCLGLVHECAADEELDASARARAESRSVIEKADLAEMKKKANADLLPPEEEIRLGLAAHWQSWKSPQVQQRIRAFLDRTKRG